MVDWDARARQIAGADQDPEMLDAFAFYLENTKSPRIPPERLTARSLPDGLRSSGLKISRGHEHFDALHEHLATYRKQNRIMLKLVPDAKPDSDGKLPYQVQFERVPDKVALAIGDIATNARAALDHLAWGVSDTTQRDANKRDVKFPYVENSNTSNPGLLPTKHLKALPGAATRALAIIERFQCYDVDDGQHRPKLAALDWLLTIANGDKHRVVTPVTMAVGQLSLKYGDGQEMAMMVAGGMKAGHELRLPPLMSDGESNFTGHASCDVGLKEVPYTPPLVTLTLGGGAGPLETTMESVLLHVLRYVEKVWIAFENEPSLFT